MHVLRTKKVKNRKEHSCFGCDREFEKGATMEVKTTVDGGDFFTARLCITCEEYSRSCLDDGDMYGYGELKSEGEDEWEAVRKEVEDKATTV